MVLTVVFLFVWRCLCLLVSIDGNNLLGFDGWLYATFDELYGKSSILEVLKIDVNLRTVPLEMMCS